MQEKEIIEITKNYLLNSKNNAALFINGMWGSGKTYFVKNKLYQEINTLGFKVIYVSLNGVKNTDELKSLVFSQSVIQGVFTERKIVTEFTQRFSKLFSESSIMKIIKPSDFVIFDKVVICFDDVERISNSFKIEDALGCINSEYVEHNGIKVILIGDETKNQLEETSYKKTKEKLIGWTLDYEHDLKESLLSIKKIWNNNTFEKLVEQQFDFMFDTINIIQCQNLRTVIFALDCLSKISTFSQKLEEETLKEIIYFTFCISKEYKRGIISSNLEADSHIRTTGHRFVLSGRELGLNLQDDKKRDYEDVFNNGLKWNKHLNGNQINYRFFESIFKFITTGYFDEVEFKKDIDALDSEKEKKRTDENDRIVNNLGGFPNLTNQELNEILKVSLHKLRSNEFSLYHFLLLCRNLLMLQSFKLIEMSTEEISSLFLTHYDSVLIKSKKNEESHIERFFPDMMKYDEKLSKELENRWELYKQKLIVNYYTNLLDNWDFDTSFNQLIQNVDTNKIANEFIKKVEDRNYISSVLSSIKRAYSSINSGQIHYSEKDKLLDLATLLDTLSIETNLILIDKYVIDEIVTALKKGAEHLEAILLPP